MNKLTPEQRQKIIDRVYVERSKLVDEFIEAVHAWKKAHDEDMGMRMSNQFGRLDVLAKLLGSHVYELIDQLKAEGRL